MAVIGAVPVWAAAIDLHIEREARVSLKPGRPEPAAAGGFGRVRGGLPLARLRRRRARLGQGLAGSGAAHLLVLALLLVIRPSSPPPTNEPPSVEMVFGHNGSAGLQGPSVSQEQQGALPPPETAPAPEPLQPPPAPAPPVQQAPPAPPAAPPAPPPPPVRREEAVPVRPQPRPRREVRRQTRSSNPFANLTDLSLAPVASTLSPSVTRRGRGGSGAAVSLSIGPLVEGGHLSMPFSMRGGHGMTSDYQEMIDDWVNRHKYYPQSAAERGHDGQVALHVVWNRDGKVLSVRLIYGSGDSDLDDAWVGLFRGAHLPPPPPDVSGDPIQYDMIMNYELLR